MSPPATTYPRRVLNFGHPSPTDPSFPGSLPLWPGAVYQTPRGSSQADSPPRLLLSPEDSSGCNHPFAAQRRPIPCSLMMATTTDQRRPLPQPSSVVVSFPEIPTAALMTVPLQQQPPFDLKAAFSSPLPGFISMTSCDASHEDRHQMPMPMPCSGPLIMSSDLQIQPAISSPTGIAVAASRVATMTPSSTTLKTVSWASPASSAMCHNGGSDIYVEDSLMCTEEGTLMFEDNEYGPSKRTKYNQPFWYDTKYITVVNNPGRPIPGRPKRFGNL